MFLGDRRELVERLILAATEAERQAALDALLPLQREDFVGIFRAMDGLPVTVRLIDPPLHEFLPSLEELAAKVAVAEATGHDPGHDAVLLAAVRRMHEQNPMLGLRGVRLGPGHPRPVRDAGARDRRGGGRGAGRGRRSATRRSWCRWSARCRSWRRYGRRRSRCSPTWPGRPGVRGATR